MKPTIGRVVVYKTTEEQKQSMRVNHCNVADELPATVVATWGEDTVNLKVELDGPGQFWITSAVKGDEPGQWHWPVIEK